MPLLIEFEYNFGYKRNTSLSKSIRKDYDLGKLEYLHTHKHIFAGFAGKLENNGST